mmetsp:Transcript_40329/g.121505  ORF Transcript_40329/g.121505 Transcript_40329/m.121505 type:complete len:250 (-) Transcript_40329:37-786(-)
MAGAFGSSVLRTAATCSTSPATDLKGLPPPELPYPWKLTSSIRSPPSSAGSGTTSPPPPPPPPVPVDVAEVLHDSVAARDASAPSANVDVDEGFPPDVPGAASVITVAFLLASIFPPPPNGSLRGDATRRTFVSSNPSPRRTATAAPAVTPPPNLDAAKSYPPSSFPEGRVISCARRTSGSWRRRTSAARPGRFPRFCTTTFIVIVSIGRTLPMGSSIDRVLMTRGTGTDLLSISGIERGSGWARGLLV